MKVLLINGQNHKGSTYHIGRILAEKLTLPAEIDEIFLPRDMPHFAAAAPGAMEGESLCPHYETTKPLTERMDEADVLIFTSPVYVYHATGSMKAFLDHYGYRWMVHRPEAKMFGKQAVVISTAAGAGMKPTCKDIADSCFFWGIGKNLSLWAGCSRHQVERGIGKETAADREEDQPIGVEDQRQSKERETIAEDERPLQGHEHRAETRL